MPFTPPSRAKQAMCVSILFLLLIFSAQPGFAQFLPHTVGNSKSASESEGSESASTAETAAKSTEGSTEGSTADSTAGSAAKSSAETSAEKLELSPGEIEWRKQKEQKAEELQESLDSLPSATATIDFFKELERLKALGERQEKEAAVAQEQAELCEKKDKEAEARIARDKDRFYRARAKSIAQAREQMLASFEAAYPSEDERKTIKTKAFKELSRLKSAEKRATEKKTKKAMAKAEQKRKEASELAQKARAELARAKSAEGKKLAELRLDFADLSGRVQDYRKKALEAELSVRNAEEEFQSLRARLNEMTPQVLELPAGVEKVVEKRKSWLSKRAQLKKSAEVLEQKADVLRERVEKLRKQRDQYRENYDRIYGALARHSSNKSYRQRVYFSRQVYRLAAELLDLFRTRIEWIEREKKFRLRAKETYDWALKEISSHVEARYAGQTARQCFSFLLGIALTLLLAWLIRLLLNHLLRRFADRSAWNWDNIAIEELALPIRIICILAGIWLSLELLSLPDDLFALLASIRRSIGALCLGLVIWRILNILSRVLEPRFSATDTTLDDQLLRFLRRTLRVLIIVLTAVYLLENFGWKVSSLLAGLGIGGLAFALAAKDTIANLFGSIVLFLDRPFHIGNWIKIAGAEGIVEDIGIRSTRIRTFKDTVVTIPNATVANSSAENIHSFRKRRLYFTLTLRLDTTPEKVEAAIEGIRKLLQEDPMIYEGYYVYLSGIPANGIEVMVYCFVKTRDWGLWLEHGQKVYLSVLRMLHSMGVGLAYNTQTIELENKLPIEVMDVMKGGK